MQQLYSLGERRINRAGYFPFFQVHLLNLHGLNALKHPQNHAAESYSQNLHVLVSALNPSLKAAAKK